MKFSISCVHLRAFIKNFIQKIGARVNFPHQLFTLGRIWSTRQSLNCMPCTRFRQQTPRNVLVKPWLSSWKFCTLIDTSVNCLCGHTKTNKRPRTGCTLLRTKWNPPPTQNFTGNDMRITNVCDIRKNWYFPVVCTFGEMRKQHKRKYDSLCAAWNMDEDYCKLQNQHEMAKLRNWLVPIQVEGKLICCSCRDKKFEVTGKRPWFLGMSVKIGKAAQHAERLRTLQTSSLRTAIESIGSLEWWSWRTRTWGTPFTGQTPPQFYHFKLVKNDYHDWQKRGNKYKKNFEKNNQKKKERKDPVSLDQSSWWPFLWRVDAGDPFITASSPELLLLWSKTSTGRWMTRAKNITHGKTPKRKILPKWLAFVSHEPIAVRRYNWCRTRTSQQDAPVLRVFFGSLFFLHLLFNFGKDFLLSDVVHLCHFPRCYSPDEVDYELQRNEGHKTCQTQVFCWCVCFMAKLLVTLLYFIIQSVRCSAGGLQQSRHNMSCLNQSPSWQFSLCDQLPTTNFTPKTSNVRAISQKTFMLNTGKKKKKKKEVGLEHLFVTTPFNACEFLFYEKVLFQFDNTRRAVPRRTCRPRFHTLQQEQIDARYLVCLNSGKERTLTANQYMLSNSSIHNITLKKR